MDYFFQLKKYLPGVPFFACRIGDRGANNICLSCISYLFPVDYLISTMEGSMRIQIMVLIIGLLAAVPVYGAPVKDTVTLKGVVVTDAGTPVTNTRITVSGGPGVFTSEKGEFLLKLSKDYLEGEQVHLFVYKEGWVINHPLDGLWNLPNIRYQDTHTTRVVLVPPGSKALWSHERIEKHIALLATDVAKRPLPVGEGPR